MLEDDLVSPSMLETILSDFRNEIEQSNKSNTIKLLSKIETANNDLKEGQESFYKGWSEQMKAWRRARSDMQLYFEDMKKRDALREEYTAVVDSIDMLIDIFKIGMQFHNKERLTKKDLEINQIKYNVIDQIKQKTQSIRAQIGIGLIADQKYYTLNLQKYETNVTLIDPEKMRNSMIEIIQQKYLKPVMK